MVRIQEPTCAARMQNLRERRGEAGGMHNRANCRNRKNTRLVEIPSEEVIQLDQEKIQQLETW